MIGVRTKCTGLGRPLMGPPITVLIAPPLIVNTNRRLLSGLPKKLTPVPILAGPLGPKPPPPFGLTERERLRLGGKRLAKLRHGPSSPLLLELITASACPRDAALVPLRGHRLLRTPIAGPLNMTSTTKKMDT